jgi:2-oxoglutarate dehydrogenase complex dehydrogenase (E1) component-like enzyme|tara:strand:- start:100 stop:243 length:144 start_codon:yes stop_codon:yes gene_type:complete
MSSTEVINGEEQRLHFNGRTTMASPAEGWGALAEAEQTRIIEEAILK